MYIFSKYRFLKFIWNLFVLLVWLVILIEFMNDILYDRIVNISFLCVDNIGLGY